MTRRERDEEREDRIEMEIIVDTYSADEQAMGWYAYLDDTLEFPLDARCIEEREESPRSHESPKEVRTNPQVASVGR